MPKNNRGFGDLPIAAKLNIVLLAAIVAILFLAGLFLIMGTTSSASPPR